ncbi:PREDICTED: uncharacterized protein LOC104753590 [Camelina sativa]|uniref:Uncharacterized protein LOC104753590 n=1 Tax=Camelina sativa TaxID=90675 RepID=A0ABM0WPD9_CAMSA|nr:PREDICTED: uncharacterized protein LOC104753590 [Camelina sativa]
MSGSNSPASVSETIVVSPSSTLVNVNMMNVTKLTASNFLMWSRQVHALLDGYDLAGYIDGSLTVPPLTVTAADFFFANPDFVVWKRQDRLIYSALLGAISISVQPILSKAVTAQDIWTTLSSTYANPSHGFTIRFDQLALLGKPVEHEAQIEFILEGLSEDYKTTKLATKAALTSSLPATANVATYRGNNSSRPHGRNNNRNNHTDNNWSPNPQHQHQQYSPRPYQGKCQICGVYGHSARRCSQLQLPPMPYSSNQSSVSSVTPWQPRAHLATTQQYNPGNWLLDTGATHHLTSDLNNLALHQPYTGGEEVTTADGLGMPISHTSSALMH